MLILILPTRLKFSLLSTSVFRNLTTFWVETKWQNTSECSTGIGHCGATDVINILHPCWKIILCIWWSRKTPGRGVWGEIWFLFKYSPFWVEGYAGKHWWWVAAIGKISYKLLVLTIALKKFEEYMKCCLLSNVQVSKNLFSRVYCNSWNEPLFPFEIELHSVPDHESINPLHPIISMCLLHTILYTIISWGADKENLVNNQELF